jgi:ribonuclease VapC
MREQGISEAEKVILQLDRFPIQIVDVNKELANEAAKLKGEFRIAYADCFALALSVKLGAAIVTGDPDFKKLQERISIQWINV